MCVFCAKGFARAALWGYHVSSLGIGPKPVQITNPPSADDRINLGSKSRI